MKRNTSSASATSERAFALRDLVALLAALALLGVVYLPAWGTSRSAGDEVTCLNHHRALVNAWYQYAEDHMGTLPGNLDGGSNANRTNDTWCVGWLDYFNTNRDNTNTVNLLNSQLGAYTRDAAVYRCPEDRSSVRHSGVERPRVRSISMNSYLNSSSPYTPGYMVFRRVSDLGRPSPASLFVFSDEHPDSVNDGVLYVDMRGGVDAVQATIVDYPASWHNGGSILSFADGRAETHRWLDVRTRIAIGYNPIPLGTPSPGNPDVLWLTAHASRKTE